MSAKTGEWGAAKDPKSGRTYYYNVITKETTWNKPLELATPEERVEMLRKKAETMRFFKEMEANIYRKLSGIEDDVVAVPARDASDGTRTRSGTIVSRVRTISSIDDSLLDFFPPRISNAASLAPGKGPARATGDAKYLDEKYALDEPIKIHNIQITPNGLKRRNSTGTIYVGTTMSEQDNEATIQCVCVVIRTHMLDAARDGIEPLRRYEVFKDAAYVSGKAQQSKGESDTLKVPALPEVFDFFNLIFSKSQLENECIIIALIYCERLVKETKGRLCIRYDNWRSIVFACLVMASKVWDDMSMWNVDFSQVCASFDLRRINELELAMLEELKFVIRVSASEYAKYYFHLRSMMSRLGYHENEAIKLAPLDMAGARRLQLATENFNPEDEGGRRRTRTMHLGTVEMMRMQSLDEFDDHHVLVGLEQLVHNEHVDADGMVHVSNEKKKAAKKRANHRASFSLDPASDAKAERK